MTKIVLSVLALAALSTASFADRSQNDFSRANGGALIEAAGLAVYGGSTASMDFETKEGGR